MTLRDVQVWMVSAITGADVDAAAPERFVTASERMSAADRFDVYRSGYRLRLLECLEDDYPTLARLLGPERFDEACRAYVDRHPSTSPNLNFFGRHMSAFLRERAEEGDARFGGAFAAELAGLEWALVEVLHEAIPPGLDAAALEKVPPADWARARLTRSDAVRLLRFAYPVNAWFQASLDGGAPPPVPAEAATAVVVYRQDVRLWRMDLTPAMVTVLAPLLEGQTIGEALERLETEVTDPAALEDAARSLGVWFREWSGAGFFTGVELGAST